MVDMRLEVGVPVSDVDRSKQFYGRLGWRLDRRRCPSRRRSHRPVHAPGAWCLVTFGKGITAAAPGSAAGALVVSDILSAHQDLVGVVLRRATCGHGRPVPRGGAGRRS